MKNYKTKRIQKNDAITIISLVVIIVVILILAGASIGLIVKNNGIIKNATTLKKTTNEHAENENAEFGKIKAELNKFTAGKTEQNTNKKGNAKQIKENAEITYGKEVANYTVKDAQNGEIQADKDVKWKIFYADDENVYLIADNYVKNTDLPYARTLNSDGTTSETTKLPNKFTEEDANCVNAKQYRAHFVNVVSAYSGMDRIISNESYGNSLKSMSKKYFDLYPDGIITSNNVAKRTKYGNNKAVAYMQDTEAWSIYTDSKGYADYAIGAPSLEMLYDSYLQTHPKVKDKFKYTVTGEEKEKNSEGATGTGYAGYQISWDGGTTWKTWTDSGSGYLSSDTNNLYVVDTDHKNAYAYWVSASSAAYDETLMTVYYYGRVRYYHYDSKLIAFRPVVRLSSQVTLELNEETGKYEIKE